MSSIIKYKDGWRAYLYVKGTRESRLFKTEAEADVWASGREEELKHGLCRDDLGKYGGYKPLTIKALRELPLVRSTDRVCGVYFLWNLSEALVYVGQSKDIAVRVACHRTKPPTDFFSATFLQVPHPWQLAIERIYIDKYVGRTIDARSGICLVNHAF
jgi:hypothetical protein